MKEEFKNFTDDRIKEVRVLGGCACIEVYDRKDINGFNEFAYENGVFNRTFLNIIYAMCPYIISENDLRKVMNVFKAWFKRG